MSERVRRYICQGCGEYADQCTCGPDTEIASLRAELEKAKAANAQMGDAIERLSSKLGFMGTADWVVSKALSTLAQSEADKAALREALVHICGEWDEQSTRIKSAMNKDTPSWYFIDVLIERAKTVLNRLKDGIPLG